MNPATEETKAELVLFKCVQCYVYAPIPAGTTLGHRAETWDVDNWMKETSIRVVACGDNLSILLSDPESGEMFAECPVPNNLPTQAAVEPVIDSSRYYVLKVVDPSSRRHAFLGIGFRDREVSSDFLMSVNEHRHYLQRKDEASRLKAKFCGDDQAEVDYRLKPGSTMKLALPFKPGKLMTNSKSGARNLFDGNEGGPKLCAPPPPIPAPKEHLLQTRLDDDEGNDDSWGEFVGI